MPALPKLPRKNKHQSHVDRPAVITGNFSLHYEDVINNNRFLVTFFVLTGLLAAAVFVPTAVYQSTADSQRIIIDAESGTVINSSNLIIVKGDATAGGEGYVEFQ